MTMRWTGGLAVVVLLAGGAQIASAADLPAQVYTKAAPAVAPAPTWTGFYAGVNLGGAWSNSDPNTSTVFSPGAISRPRGAAINAVGVSTSARAASLAVSVGYNQQFDRFVAGIEAMSER